MEAYEWALTKYDQWKDMAEPVVLHPARHICELAELLGEPECEIALKQVREDFQAGLHILVILEHPTEKWVLMPVKRQDVPQTLQ